MQRHNYRRGNQLEYRQSTYQQPYKNSSGHLIVVGILVVRMIVIRKHDELSVRCRVPLPPRSKTVGAAIEFQAQPG
jgi:hypothetical protein